MDEATPSFGSKVSHARRPFVPPLLIGCGAGLATIQLIPLTTITQPPVCAPPQHFWPFPSACVRPHRFYLYVAVFLLFGGASLAELPHVGYDYSSYGGYGGYGGYEEGTVAPGILVASSRIKASSIDRLGQLFCQWRWLE